MKLSWKLFFITTPMFVLFLTVFGAWMIQDSFRSSLDKESERCMVENQMFQNSYELTRHGLSEEIQEQASTSKMIESFYRKKNQEDSSVRILDADGKVLYQDSELYLDHGIIEYLDEEKNVGNKILRQDGETYLVVVCRTSFGEYIETTKNITGVFESRDAMYARYQIGVLAMAALVGGVTLLVIFWVMRNMKKLSWATRQFAKGRYGTRVKIRSRDEIGVLAADFNWMANKMNGQMEQLKGEVQRQEEFTAAFAHELKTPLTSIIGYADTIRQMELTPEETHMCANYIYSQGKRLQSLSYKLLEMTMAGNQEISFCEIRVPGFLTEIRRTVLPSLLKKNLTLYAAAEDGVIYGDQELLASVFINLIDNARKASEPGKVIRLVGKKTEEGYAIAVSDEGGGIPSEELSRVTEAFYMVDKSRARKEGGAGLGLTLCKKIIDLHNGTWQMDNEPGKGLKVTVYFKASREAQMEDV